MAKRNTTHILKNSNILNRPLPTSLLLGEPIVNTAEGILLFSGNSMSTNEWTPNNVNPTFFEVGSNLYDLKLRNKIISYQNISGAGLSGKFLSGSTNGFVLADISSISGSINDTYVTGGTYSNGTAIFTNNFGNSFNVNGFSTGYTLTSSAITSTLGYTPYNSSNPNGYISGITSLNVTNALGYTPISADTFVTGVTFNSLTNSLIISQNNNLSNLNVNINSFSGISISDLTANKLVFTTTNGKLLTGNALFDGVDLILPNNGKLNVGSGGLIVGSGGNPTTPGTGDLTVNGNLIVYGNSFSAHTSELYIEDNNIILNYNPTGDTSSSSIGSGLTIQDGSGISGSSVVFEVRPMNNFVLQNSGEYSGLTGYLNRGFVTQLNDIVIRSTNTSTPNGVRVLAENDILDAGQY